MKSQGPADLLRKLQCISVSGITDDDLRETAFEILLACAGASGYTEYCLAYFLLSLFS
jgi:hypothetical protein